MSLIIVLYQSLMWSELGRKIQPVWRPAASLKTLIWSREVPSQPRNELDCSLKPEKSTQINPFTSLLYPDSCCLSQEHASTHHISFLVFRLKQGLQISPRKGRYHVTAGETSCTHSSFKKIVARIRTKEALFVNRFVNFCC